MLNSLLPVVAALLPGMLLLFYIYRQDKKQPEPLSWLWKGVLYGVLSALLAMLNPFPAPNEVIPELDETVLGAVLDAFFAAAIPEETVKLLLLYLLLRHNPYFDEHLDGIVYATCVGLGFAGLENILYVCQNLDDFVIVATIRGLFSVPGHFLFAVAMGYYYSLAHFENCSQLKRMRYLMLSFLVPVMLHGIFDSLLMSLSVSTSMSVICILAFLWFNHKMRAKGRERIRKLKEKDQNETM